MADFFKTKFSCRQENLLNKEKNMIINLKTYALWGEIKIDFEKINKI